MGMVGAVQGGAGTVGAVAQAAKRERLVVPSPNTGTATVIAVEMVELVVLTAMRGAVGQMAKAHRRYEQHGGPVLPPREPGSLG